MDYLCSDAGIAPKSLIFFLCLFVVNFTGDTLLITQLIQYQDGLFLVPLLMDSDITEVPALFASTPMVDIRDPTNRYSNMYFNPCANVRVRWCLEPSQPQRIISGMC